MLESFGAWTQAQRVAPNTLASLSTPAILYFRPGRWPTFPSETTGHFVLLVRADATRVTIVDWSPANSSPVVELPTAAVSSRWDGEVIVAATDRRSHYGIGVLLGAIVCLIGIRHVSHRRRNLPAGAPVVNARGAILCCLMIGAIPGCANKSPPRIDRPTLDVKKPVTAIGRVTGDHLLECSFDFQVWDRGSVTIKRLNSSCGCTTPDRTLIDRPLTASSRESITLVVRPDGEGAVTTRTVTIETDPPSPLPIILAVQYQRMQPPRVSHEQIEIVCDSTEVPSSELTVVHRRLPSDPVQSLDLPKCVGTDLTIHSKESRTERITLDRNRDDVLEVDTIVLRLQAKRPMPFGRHIGSFSLVWHDGRKQILRTEIEVSHPFAPEIRRLFVGVKPPGASWTDSVRLRKRKGSEGVSVAHVQTTVPGATVTMEDDARLAIRGRAPVDPGRFEGEVVIEYHPSSIPSLRIPVSGIVRVDSRDK